MGIYRSHKTENPSHSSFCGKNAFEQYSIEIKKSKTFKDLYRIAIYDK